MCDYSAWCLLLSPPNCGPKHWWSTCHLWQNVVRKEWIRSINIIHFSLLHTSPKCFLYWKWSFLVTVFGDALIYAFSITSGQYWGGWLVFVYRPIRWPMPVADNNLLWLINLQWLYLQIYTWLQLVKQVEDEQHPYLKPCSRPRALWFCSCWASCGCCCTMWPDSPSVNTLESWQKMDVNLNLTGAWRCISGSKAVTPVNYWFWCLRTAAIQLSTCHIKHLLRGYSHSNRE